MKKIMTLIVLCCLPIAAFSITLPVSAYTATYTFEGDGAKGTVTRSLDFPEKNKYTIQSILEAHKAIFSNTITRTADGVVQGYKLRPISLVTHNAKTDHEVTQNIPNGAVDQLSAILQMRLDLIHRKTSFTFNIIENNKVLEIPFKVINRHANLKTPMGVLDTIQVGGNNKGHIELYWFSKKYDYLMVGAQVSENQKVTMKSMLSEYTAK
ncbi:MAG: DUF3108 domain-containing protein [Gammaproteobacteria bacterium]